MPRKQRLARVVDKMLASWAAGVEALDLASIFAEYLELRPRDMTTLEALVATETTAGGAALRSYFETKLSDPAVAADLDRLDALDTALEPAAPLAVGVTPAALLDGRRVARKAALRDRLRTECLRVEALADDVEAEAYRAAVPPPEDEPRGAAESPS